MEKLTNRYDAGRQLAEKIQKIVLPAETIVLALPRGGVPVAYVIAEKLNKPLDVLIVRKLGVPDQPELAFGAIAANNMEIYNEDILKVIPLSQNQIEKVLQIEHAELQRREQKYRDNRPWPELSQKTIILVDDGIATGATISVAIKALRYMHAKKIILAVPVMSADVYPKMKTLVEKVVCLRIPKYFNAVGEWYQSFLQTEDREVYDLLNLAKRPE